MSATLASPPAPVTAPEFDELIEAAGRTAGALAQRLWWLRLTPAGIEVHADPAAVIARRSDARAAHFAGAAAISAMALAASAQGREPIVRLVPDSSRPTLLATVRLGMRRRPDRGDALLSRYASRPALWQVARSRPVSTATLDELTATAARVGASLTVVGEERHGGPTPSVATLATLSTRGDAPIDWLRAGQALHRLRAAGGAHQAIVMALPESCWPADVDWHGDGKRRAEHGRPATVQALLRVSGR